MRRTRATAAMSLFLTAALAVGGAPPGYANSARPDFAAQARGYGLSDAQAASLQRRVDTYLARTGGTQVAINKIDLDGKGVLLLTLPGQKHAHEIGAPNRPDATFADCEVRNFCAYSAPDLTGDLIMYYYCTYKLSMPFAGYGSYFNIQIAGASAHFYDSNRAYMYDSLAAFSSSSPFYWSPVYWVKPCGGI